MSNTDQGAGRGAMTASARLAPYAGSTQWNRECIDRAVAHYHRHTKAVKPMVAVKNMSPQFLDMAIELDVLLSDYRDKVGRFQLLLRYFKRNGVKIERKSASGRVEWLPELREIEARCGVLNSEIGAMIRKIETTKATRHGDRVLKKRAADLGLDHWWRQLDWLEVMFAEDSWERS